MKLFVGIPAYDRKIGAETVRSLLDERGAASHVGVDLDVCIAPGSSLITHARDYIARDFMASDADRLVFVDADVGWEPGSLIKLAMHRFEFVGGAYRYKNDVEGYPVKWLQDRAELWANDDGLLEVEAVPGGFLSLTKGALETMRDHFKRDSYAHGPDTFYPWFWCPPGTGEDYTFCREWREAGGKVYLDPTLTLHHVEGAKKYSGNIGDWLRQRDGNQ